MGAPAIHAYPIKAAEEVFGSTTPLNVGDRQSSYLLQNLGLEAPAEVKFNGKFII
jgi:hypothetical protein